MPVSQVSNPWAQPLLLMPPMLPAPFCSANVVSVLWKSLLTVTGTVAFAAGHPWGKTDLSYSPDQLQALKQVSRSVQQSVEGMARSGIRSDARAGAGLRVGMRWLVAMERTRPQGMKPVGAEVGSTRYEESLRDLAVFRYEVTSRNPEGGYDISIRPVADRGAGVDVRWVDPRFEEVLLTLDPHGRQVAKSYVFPSDPSDLDRVARVSPVGVRSKISGLELFPLDWPSGLVRSSSRAREVLREGRVEGATVDLRLPAGLQELLNRSEFADPAPKAGIRARDAVKGPDSGDVGSGSDFFGRPIEARYTQGFPWPERLESAQGVAVLLRIESYGQG